MVNETQPTAVSADQSAIFFKRKAKSIECQVQKMGKAIEPGKIGALSEEELTVRLKSLESAQESFKQAHNRLEELDFDEIGSELRENFDETAVLLEARLRREINRRQIAAPHSSTMRNEQTGETQTVIFHNRSRLPELKLPEFSGGYTKYTDFSSMFNAIIDKDPSLSNVEKLQHLRSCLKGSALDTISSLEIKDANYDIAVELLKKRFNNQRLIFQAHVTEILGLERVDSPSAVKLRALSDTVNANIRALKTLGNTEQIGGCIIVHSLLQKVDSATQARWEETMPLNVIPTCEQFTTFLEQRCQKLENVEHAMATYAPSPQVGKSSKASNNCRKSLVATNSKANGCIFCDTAGHFIYSCSRFGNLSPQLRLREAKKLSLCINCLKKGHQMKACSAGSCRLCGVKHHTLLHFDSQAGASQSQIAQSAPPNAQVAPSSFVAQNLSSDVVLLATAVINVRNRSGTLVPCRALLDSGSQVHIITSRLAHQLQLRKTKALASISGLGDSNFASEGFSVNINLNSQTSDYSTNITAFVAPSITENQPNYSVDIDQWNIPSNIRLADPAFNRSQQIDMLIGAGLFFDLLCVGQIKLDPGLPLLHKTQLGWIVTGGGAHSRRAAALTTKFVPSSEAESDSKVDEIVRRFWELESCSESVSTSTKEELDCEAHFNENFSRLSTGEYSVRLPVKHSVGLLGDSYQQAYRRFLNLERKLDRNPQLKTQYAAFIKEYLELNHMSLVNSNSLSLCKYFLPHHCVFKEDSTTTRLRVVFDGSAVSTSGYSLNEVLMAGPTIQPKLFNTLLQFRTFLIALTGDIGKMYRCVRMAEPDSYFQCILWRDSSSGDIQVYKLDTVTYGTKPASFLAVRAMHQLASDEKETFPIGAEILLRHFYVDDLISGGNSAQEVIEIMRQTTELLKKGNFKLRKWCSNDAVVLEQIPDEDKETFLKFDDGSDITKTLGLAWDPSSDKLLFSFSSMYIPEKPSKRSVLSSIARFYDPLGLIGPVIAKAKIFLQNLWREKLNWDESLPESLNLTWLTLCADISRTPQFEVNRLAIIPQGVIEVHGFSDASIDAYGACIYVVSMAEGKREVHLLCSKSRVAPLKTLTVPKLELCGAVILSQLIREIEKMNLFSCPFYCWSDSVVVLAWIRDEPSRFQIFTANRISLIQELTTGMEWRHVPTAFNPADILSRGALPSELTKSSLWIHGPDFLAKGKSEWPSSSLPKQPLPELRKKVLVGVAGSVDLIKDCKFANCFEKLRRVFAYIYKFRHRIRHPNLTTDCLRMGTQMLIRSIQMSYLWDDYSALQGGKQVKASSSIASLSPFLDHFGLVRVGGRLENSALDFKAQHPIILPRRHPVTRAIIMYFHKRNLHAGPRSLLAQIRLQYWPIGGRKTVAGAASKCITCFRAKPTFAETIMAALPEDRVSGSHTFMVTGVDFCGPFYFKSEIRSRAPQKCYVCIFICFATKAVHLELVQDLSTAAFLNALRRFVLTRCKPARIWSDNATNFVGARNEMAELKRLFLSDAHINAVQEFCLADDIEWRFIPPRSPHFGGLWEAAVKTAKHHFYRSVGPSLLPFDELRTLICHIGAIINSRPLLPISEHPADLDVLTPAHFLSTVPLTLFPEPDVTKLNFNRLDRWQRMTYYQQIFWTRWREEYLTLLQQRSKWRTPQPGVCINDVVLVKDENLPPLKWPLARVVELIVGADNVSRVAVLRTSTGLIRRAVRKLCVLPKQDDVESPCLPTGGKCLVTQPTQQQQPKSLI